MPIDSMKPQLQIVKAGENAQINKVQSSINYCQDMVVQMIQHE